jgi:hypothetical protein
METKLRILVAVSAVQALALLWLCVQRPAPFPSAAHAADAQSVSLVDHRLSRYSPLPVMIRNDDAIRVRCVD